MERAKERFNKPESYIKETVEYMLKLAKKHKIQPKKSLNNSYTLVFEEFKIAYTKESWQTVIITIAQRDIDTSNL